MYISVCGCTVQATQVEVSGAVSWSPLGLGKRVFFLVFFKSLRKKSGYVHFFFFFLTALTNYRMSEDARYRQILKIKITDKKKRQKKN